MPGIENTGIKCPNCDDEDLWLHSDHNRYCHKCGYSEPHDEPDTMDWMDHNG